MCSHSSFTIFCSSSIYGTYKQYILYCDYSALYVVLRVGICRALHPAAVMSSNTFLIAHLVPWAWFVRDDRVHATLFRARERKSYSAQHTQCDFVYFFHYYSLFKLCSYSCHPTHTRSQVALSKSIKKFRALFCKRQFSYIYICMYIRASPIHEPFSYSSFFQRVWFTHDDH